MTLADIPTNLITGRRGSGKSRVIRHLLSQRPAGERWAVLANDVDAGSPPSVETLNDGVYLSVVADGCICCSGQLGLRVALSRLLREARPQRLLIEASALARTPELLKVLHDRWLAPVLQLRATVVTLNTAQHDSGVITDMLDRERVRHADVVGINANAADADHLADALARNAAEISSHAQIAKLRLGQLDVVLLDRPARTEACDITPRFHSDR